MALLNATVVLLANTTVIKTNVGVIIGVACIPPVAQGLVVVSVHY